MWIATRQCVVWPRYTSKPKLFDRGTFWPCHRAYRRAIARGRPHLGDLGPFGAVNLHRLHDKCVLFRRRLFQVEVGFQVVVPPACVVRTPGRGVRGLGLDANR